MSLLLFDLGNSRLKFAPLHADGIGEGIAIAHDGEHLPAGWDAGLPTGFESAVIASVASSALLAQLLEALTARCARISIARCAPVFGELRLAYSEPRTLGVDRFLAMLGARARGRQPWLVVGIGTALTLDLIDDQGRHRGGKIAPSPTLMRAALHARARQLPETGGEFAAFADNTPDALRSGCDGAAIALIERSSHDAGALLGTPPKLIFHGGGVDALHGELPQANIRAPALVLEGLAVWARISR
ncbi:MAG: type III pantothenate kinase [Lysobacteraceae bacterium]|nr:MAG: type III pantothenate kinase [Xanthomonadaceae bacterium]